MSETIKQHYKDAVIQYSELHDHWTALIDYNEIGDYPSLSKAKEGVDKHLKKTKDFTRFEAWIRTGGVVPWIKATVTSKAESDSYLRRNSSYYWITQNGKRSKEQAKLLKPCISANDSLIAEILELYGKRREIQGKIDTKEKALYSLEDHEEAQEKSKKDKQGGK